VGLVSLLLLFGPFSRAVLGLLSRGVKRRKPLLLAAAVWMLAMQWADVYWLVFPSERAAARSRCH
jgi:hypothetical protein